MNLYLLEYALKKVISHALMPSGLVLLCLFLGIFIWPLKRRRALSRSLFVLAFVIYGLGSNDAISNLLILGLEHAARLETGVPQADGGITTAVLITGGASLDGDLPLVDRLTPATRLRVLKARELLLEHPEIRRLVITGGCARVSGTCAMSEAEMASLWLRELGVPETVSVVLEERSRDTEENVRNIVAVVGQAPFYVVTSAYHVPRVSILARRLHLEIYPVPSNFLESKAELTSWNLWPSPGNLWKTDLACHEYLGMGWLWVKHYAAVLLTKF